jgi:hypothetical protein
LNQVGYLLNEPKSAIILSNSNLSEYEAEVINVITGDVALSVQLKTNSGKYAGFNFSYIVDFSTMTQKGEYKISVADRESKKFIIDENVYKLVSEKLLEFFRIQRCGYTEPYLHNVCHISDATSIIDGNRRINQTIDVTGGWHDAGDYIKFFNTTAFSTYMLLFAYEFDPVKFSFDNNKNGAPDILEEAKIGLDWLLRAVYKNDRFITQVQDLRDHEVGWRLPEEDQLGFDRPAFVGIGKNLIGIYSAVMALGSRIWKEKFQLHDFAEKCLKSAEYFYSIRNRVKDIDNSGTGMYVDKTFEGKLALGAVELFITTKKSNYLNDSKVYADSAGSDYWWSWGDINSLAHYKLSRFDSKYIDYIKNNLVHFKKNAESNLFGIGIPLTWGTNSTLLGITLQNILLKKLSGESEFDLIANSQKDFILGKNPWGISFIYEVGSNYTSNFHHQVGYFKGKLPGGFSAGPASKQFLRNYAIEYEKPDKYAKFQTDEIFYRDDRMDYITNEPTITANATAIFVFGSLSK